MRVLTVVLAGSAMLLTGCQDTITIRAESGTVTLDATIIVVVGRENLPAVLDAVSVLPGVQ